LHRALLFGHGRPLPATRSGNDARERVVARSRRVWVHAAHRGASSGPRAGGGWPPAGDRRRAGGPGQVRRSKVVEATTLPFTWISTRCGPGRWVRIVTGRTGWRRSSVRRAPGPSSTVVHLNTLRPAPPSARGKWTA